MRRVLAAVLMAVFFSGSLVFPMAARANDKNDRKDPQPPTTTPIKHLVVIFDENNSFDHYFGTYPNATNPAGEPEFIGALETPAINGLTPTLLNDNRNPMNPFRLDRAMALTCDNDNHYTDEQAAYDGGLLDKFNITSVTTSCGEGFFFAPNLAMGYYDGNTVTALWNYAQNFAMSDNFFDTEFGTTVMGHLNLISGQTHGATVMNGTAKTTQIANGSVVANVQPFLDDCPGTTPQVVMTVKNVGDLLTAADVTWGWFYGDFGATVMNGVATCSAIYNSHYDPFQYYASTTNPHHLPPTSISKIGKNGDQANHQYDLSYFSQALENGDLPSVSFVKFSVPNTGHPSDSTPLAEQTSLVNIINEVEGSQYWKDTAIFIAYDDSDGWYDHVMPPIVNPSHDSGNDALLGTGATGGLCGPAITGAYQDRCGYGERLPFVVISPYAKADYVDHSLNDTTSILRFIENNWSLGQIGDQSFDSLAGSLLGMFDFAENKNHENRELILDPTTGERVGRW